MSYVNNSPLYRKTVEQALRDHGIALKDLSLRRQYTVCPKCSSDRKKKKAECLAVTIEANRVYWACNHCEDKGCEFLEEKQKLNSEKVYYNYTPTLRKVRLGKDHKPPFVWEHRDGTEWKSGTGGAVTKDLLYRLDGIRAAISTGKPIAIVEGEKDVDNLWKLGIPATCNAHGAGKWSTALRDGVANATVVIFPDYDTPGMNHAATILKSIKTTAKAAKIVNLKDHWETIPESGDISDYIEAGFDVPKLWKSVLESFADVRAENAENAENAKSGNGYTSLSDDEVEAMAAMSPIELAKTIKDLAAAKDVPQAAVRSEYKARKDELGIADTHKRRRFEIPETRPWDQPVNGITLTDLAKLTNRYMMLPTHGDSIVSLWTLLTYIPKVSRIAPRLQITAPEKRCGKTTLLNFLHEVVDRRVKTGNVTVAAFFRLVEGYHPTMLIDEVDSFMMKNDDICNVLNEGHDINGCVVRCEKIADNFEPVPFSCFCPVAYAHIGKLPKQMGTLLDRSITIQLSRRKNEKIEGLDHMIEDEFLILRRKLKRFAIDNEAAIKQAMDEVDLSVVKNDRARDNWKPLLAIAKIASPEWYQKALAAAAAVPEEDPSVGEMLLMDLKGIFEKEGKNFLLSTELTGELVKLEDRPWSEWGVPPRLLSAKALATLLAEFGVKPRYDNSKAYRGYLKSDLEPVWQRYTDAENHISEFIYRTTGKSVNPCKDLGISTVDRKSNLPGSTVTAEDVSDGETDDWSFNNE